MNTQEGWLDKVWKNQYEQSLQELLMTTSIARQRVTISHIQKELEKEKQRYESLKMPALKKNSGIRVSMLKDRLNTNQNILRELLVEKGYLKASPDVPF